MRTIILISTVVLFPFLGTANGERKPQPKEPELETTAEEMASDFAKYPTEGSKKYADKPLRIKARVEKVNGKDVYLKHDRAAGSVFIIIQTPDTPRVKVGQEIQAKGSITAVVGSSIWIKCAALNP